MDRNCWWGGHTRILRDQRRDPFGGLAEPDVSGLEQSTIQDVGDEPVWAIKVYGPSCAVQLLCLGGGGGLFPLSEGLTQMGF